MPETTSTLRDTGLVGLGFAVLAVRQANEAAADFEKRLTENNETLAKGLEQVRTNVETARARFEEFVAPVAERVYAQIEAFIERLPEQAQQAWKEAQKAGRDVATAFEKFLSTIPEAPAPKAPVKKSTAKAEQPAA